MFRRIDDVIACWAEESAATLRVLEALTGPSLDAMVAEGHRDLRRIAWHLVESLLELPGRLGLQVEGRHFLSEDGAICEPPATPEAIQAAYAAASGSLQAQLSAWCDADLGREDDMYGERWTRGRSLFVLVTHQAHHRGQMTVLLRQAGLRVPDVYGPAKEGWSTFGAPTPRV